MVDVTEIVDCSDVLNKDIHRMMRSLKNIKGEYKYKIMVSFFSSSFSTELIIAYDVFFTKTISIVHCFPFPQPTPHKKSVLNSHVCVVTIPDHCKNQIQYF